MCSSRWGALRGAFVYSKLELFDGQQSLSLSLIQSTLRTGEILLLDLFFLDHKGEIGAQRVRNAIILNTSTERAIPFHNLATIFIKYRSRGFS